MKRSKGQVEGRTQGSAGKSPASETTTSDTASGQEQPWILRLFVAGQSPRSLTAYANLKEICEKHLNGRYRIELIDLIKEPNLAQAYQIVAIPTLIRQQPEPIKRVIGDLSDQTRALAGMDLRP